MSTLEVDPKRCPLCGETNGCGMAQGAETCWCFEATIASDVLERIPDAAKGVACVCRSCAAGTAAARASAAEDSKNR